MKLSEKIQEARKEAHISQRELAKRIGTTPQNISQYERGVRKPKIKTLERIAAALGVDTADFMNAFFELPDGISVDDITRGPVELIQDKSILLTLTNQEADALTLLELAGFSLDFDESESVDFFYDDTGKIFNIENSDQLKDLCAALVSKNKELEELKLEAIRNYFFYLVASGSLEKYAEEDKQ